MQLDMTFYLFAIPAVLIAGISKGGFGSGAAFVATPVLALAIEPSAAVGLLLPLLMLMDVAGLKSYWGRWDWPHARTLMIGAVPGILLGAAFFAHVSADGLRLFVGLIAVGFVAWHIARSRGWARARPAKPASVVSGGLWGAVAGFTSFVSHAGGPPAAMYLLGSGLDKTRYQATTVIVFWWINLLKFPPYFALGMFTPESALANLVLAPFAIAGVVVGAVAHRYIPDAVFFQLTHVLLAVTGLKLVFDALT